MKKFIISIRILTFVFLTVSSLGGCVTVPPVKEESTLKEIVFAKRENVPLKADWYGPASTSLARGDRIPACIVIHGGGWYKGDKKDMDSIAARLADAGFGVMNINYRLAPSYRFPASVLDTKDAIRWLKGNAAKLRVDTDRICLFGYSAGAHLALMGGFTEKSDGLDDTVPASAMVYEVGSENVIKTSPENLRVRAIVAGGTPADLTDGSYNKYYEKFFGRPPSEIPEIYKAASPITYVRKGLPSVFLYHGSHDWVVDVEQSRALAKRLRDLNNDTEYLEVTLGHVATFLFDEKEINAAIKFLKGRLKP